jgi:hypothetical protein
MLDTGRSEAEIPLKSGAGYGDVFSLEIQVHPYLLFFQL